MKNLANFHLHDGIFKYWVILVKTINEFQKSHKKYPADLFYNSYINYLLLQKSEQEIIDITKELMSEFFINTNISWYFWEYSNELQNYSEPERFVWLYSEIKKLLLKEKPDIRESYIRKFDKDFLELFQDAELFD